MIAFSVTKGERYAGLNLPDNADIFCHISATGVSAFIEFMNSLNDFLLESNKISEQAFSFALYSS